MESMPVLSPFIVDRDGLHSVINNPSIHFVFENYGKTPGIIRQVRSNLILCSRDALPPTINFEEAPLQDHEAMIPGDIRGEDARLPGSSVPAEFNRPLTRTELNEIEAEAITKEYQRFYLIGLVIYDDFFGVRHTSNFCIKFRQHGFQSPKGGIAYNRVTRKKIPKNDPLDRSPS